MMAVGILPPRLLPSLQELLAEKLGHRLVARRLEQVADLVSTLAIEGGYSDIEEYLALARTLPIDAPLVQSLVRGITNKESYFFRDAATMRSLREKILPRVIDSCRASRVLRVWSAGCSTGEELYSVGILLQELIPDYDRWTVSLVGTDVDSTAVARARCAEYKAWSLRATSPEEKLRYFRENTPGTFVLRGPYRRNVSFGLHNLADGNLPLPTPGQFDLIFCRNVLIYFGPDAQEAVKRKFSLGLVERGWWIGGPSDPAPGAGWGSEVHPGLLAHRVERERGTLSDAGASTNAQPEAALRGRGWTWLEPAGRIPAESGVASWGVPRIAPAAAVAPPAQQASGDASIEETQLARARALADRGSLEEARELLAQLAGGDSLLPEVYLTLATVLQSSDQPESAIGQLKKAIYLDPSNAEAHLRLGLLFAASGARDAALRALRTAVLLVSSQEDPPPELLTVQKSAAAQVVRLLSEEGI